MMPFHRSPTLGADGARVPHANTAFTGLQPERPSRQPRPAGKRPITHPSQARSAEARSGPRPSASRALIDPSVQYSESTQPAMSTSRLLPRLSCCCSNMPASLAGRTPLATRSFSALPASRAQAPTRSTEGHAPPNSSEWKGKGKAVELVEGRANRKASGRAGRAAGAFLGSPWPPPRPTSPHLVRHNSTKSNSTRYAHESLLSLPDKAADPTGKRLGFFSRSANPAKPPKPADPVTDGLPLPSTSPLVPLHAALPAALPPTKLSDGTPNPAIRWRDNVQNSIADDLTVYKQISKVSRARFVASWVCSMLTGVCS